MAAHYHTIMVRVHEPQSSQSGIKFLIISQHPIKTCEVSDGGDMVGGSVVRKKLAVDRADVKALINNFN